MLTIILLGPPGSGKGTQSKMLRKDHPITHISPGELLREHVKNGTYIGKKVKRYLDAGELVHGDDVMEIVEEQLQANMDGEGFLFDGFPRAITQAEALEVEMKRKKFSLDAVILLDVPEEELTQRLKARAGKEKRADDQDPKKIATRMKIFKNDTLPVANFYAAQKKLYKVNGLGSVEEIYKRIVAVVEQVLANKKLTPKEKITTPKKITD